MKRFLVFAAFFSAAFGFDFSADTLLSPQLRDALASVPPRSEFPKASYYIVLDSTIVRLMPDGSWETERYFVAKSYIYKGKKELSNFKILYNASFESVELLRARTINGEEVVPVDSTQVNDITAPQYSSASMYAKMTQRVVSLPAFSESSAVEIHYVVRHRAGTSIPFGGVHVLVGDKPARKVYFGISFPRGKKVFWKSISGAPKPSVSGGVVCWEVRDYPGVQFEAGMPPLREVMPTVIYTASRSWSEEGGAVAAALLPKCEADSAVRALAESLAASAKTKKDAVAKILFYLQDRFDHIYISPNLVGYDANDAATVLRNGYADSRDAAALLVAMLRAVGVKASPALVAASGARIFDIPSVHQFDRVVVVADVGGRKLFLDPMREFAEPGYIGEPAGEKALVIENGASKLVDVPPAKPNDNRIVASYTFKIDTLGCVDGSVLVEAWGSPAQELRSLFRHAKRRRKRQRFERAASNVADGAVLVEKPQITGVDDNSQIVRAQFRIKADNFMAMQDGMGIIWLPKLPFDVVTLPDISKKEREFPLFVDEPLTVVKRYNFTFPTGFKVDYIPPIQRYEGRAGSLEISSQSGSYSFVVTVELRLNRDRIEPKAYEDVKQLVRAFGSKRYRIALLERVGP